MPQPSGQIGEQRAVSRPEVDAIDLLLQQHKEVKALFKQCHKAKGQDRKEVVNQISDALLLHGELEEQIFYPAMQDEDPEQIEHSYEEHKEAKELLFSLSDLSYLSPGFDEKLEELEESVLHHIEEEENELIPEARKALRGQLDVLGEQMIELQPKIDPGHIRNEWQRTGRVQ